MSASVEDIRLTFEHFRFARLENIVEEPIRTIVFNHIKQVANSGMLGSGDEQVPGTPTAYGDGVTETVLEWLRPKLEELTERRLYPTYSYYRLYKTGDKLARHKDRPACQISLSVNFGQVSGDPWPLWIEGPHGKYAAKLKPGDGVLYYGMECPHWREPFTGDGLAQAFLHYVEQDGPYSEWKFDKRPALSM